MIEMVAQPIIRLVYAGGPVLVVIAATAVLLFALSLERLFYWRLRYRRRRRELIRRWQARSEHLSWSARTLRDCWCNELIDRLRVSLPWLRLLVALCPLLGLVGTVTGMIQVFDSLTVTGVAQARSLSDGVARATLPTLAGMAVAVVGILFTSRFEQVVRREDQRLHDRLTRATEVDNVQTP